MERDTANKMLPGFQTQAEKESFKRFMRKPLPKGEGGVIASVDFDRSTKLLS